jgi:hypothetical protein
MDLPSEFQTSHVRALEVSDSAQQVNTRDTPPKFLNPQLAHALFYLDLNTIFYKGFSEKRSRAKSSESASQLDCNGTFIPLSDQERASLGSVPLVRFSSPIWRKDEPQILPGTDLCSNSWGIYYTKNFIQLNLKCVWILKGSVVIAGTGRS